MLTPETLRKMAEQENDHAGTCRSLRMRAFYDGRASAFREVANREVAAMLEAEQAYDFLSDADAMVRAVTDRLRAKGKVSR